MKLDVSTRRGFDLACALRGPDLSLGLHELKWLFTCRIRGLLKVQMGVLSRRTPLAPYSNEAKEALFEEIRQCMKQVPGFCHWLSHVEAAFAILRQDFPEHAAELDGLLRLADSIKTFAIIDSERSWQKVEEYLQVVLSYGQAEDEGSEGID